MRPRGPGRAPALHWSAWPCRAARAPATTGAAGADCWRRASPTLLWRHSNYWSHGDADCPPAWAQRRSVDNGEVGTHQDHRDIEHRQVDALAATGPFALEQGAGERKRANRARCIVDRG